MDYKLVCTSCKKEYSKNSSVFRCGRCNSILEVSYDYNSINLRGFRNGRISFAKYAQFYPSTRKLLTHSEGGTDLVHAKVLSSHHGAKILLKIETENPSRSFKDRGSVIEVSKAVELGFRNVCLASTGNMGLSVAIYSKRNGLKCTIFISRGANKVKLKKIREHKARIVKVRGDFNRALVLAERFATKSNAFLCGDYHYRKEGQKSLMLEIMDQLKFKIPDYVFIQVGNGTLFAASYKALLELRRFGFIKRLPKLIAVQSRECDPLIKAYNSKTEIKYIRPRTYADAIAVGYPTFGFECIKALNETHGEAISVKDSEIERARKLLLKREGLRAEPGGAVSYAGFLKMYKEENSKFTGKKVVIVVTGNNE